MQKTKYLVNDLGKSLSTIVENVAFSIFVMGLLGYQAVRFCCRKIKR